MDFQLRSGSCCVGGRPALKNLPSVLAPGCRGTLTPKGWGSLQPGARTTTAAPVVLQIICEERKHVHWNLHLKLYMLVLHVPTFNFLVRRLAWGPGRRRSCKQSRKAGSSTTMPWVYEYDLQCYHQLVKGFWMKSKRFWIESQPSVAATTPPRSESADRQKRRCCQYFD